MLSWASRFNIFCFLDNHHYNLRPHRYECLVAAGAATQISSGELEDLDRFLEKKDQWKFGHLSYELKNKIFNFTSSKKDDTGFPFFFFFTPTNLVQLKGAQLTINASNPDAVYQQIINAEYSTPSAMAGLELDQGMTRKEYQDTIGVLKEHIRRGDCYEINFCQEFFSEAASIDPLDVFRKLTALSPTPFAALYKLEENYLICASPERFLMRNGGSILSQPMKGTIKRAVDDPWHDQELKQQLAQSAKDQAENVMVVDMVRNDLSRICEAASVRVEELFTVYSFPQVHQMISTVSGRLRQGLRFSEIVRASFPMGSMTGAPKHRVLELIDEYETSARGIFSGSVGYIDPAGDFDFNVVIRSIMYNAQRRFLSYKVGSGITFYSDAEKEWEECLLKGEAIKKVLTGGPALR